MPVRGMGGEVSFRSPVDRNDRETAEEVEIDDEICLRMVVEVRVLMAENTELSQVEAVAKTVKKHLNLDNLALEEAYIKKVNSIIFKEKIMAREGRGSYYDLLKGARRNQYRPASSRGRSSRKK